MLSFKPTASTMFYVSLLKLRITNYHKLSDLKENGLLMILESRDMKSVSLGRIRVLAQPFWRP